MSVFSVLRLRRSRQVRQQVGDFRIREGIQQPLRHRRLGGFVVFFNFFLVDLDNYIGAERVGRQFDFLGAKVAAALKDRLLTASADALHPLAPPPLDPGNLRPRKESRRQQARRQQIERW